MINFAIGVAVGTAFAPFWMAVWTNQIKPLVVKVKAKLFKSE
jgi:hypothetical protein